MEGLFLLGGLGFGLMLLFPIVLLLALLVILALRHDDDVEGTRAPAIYGAVVAFLAVFTLLFAATAFVSSLLELTKDAGSPLETRVPPTMDDDFDGGFGDDMGGGLFDDDRGRDSDDEAIAGAVVALIVALVAAGVLALHRPLFERRRTVTGAGARVVRAYHLVVSLVAVLLAVVGGGMALYGVFSIIAPGVAGAEDRASALRDLVPPLVLATGAALVFRWHSQQAHLLTGPSGVSAAGAP